MALRARDQAIQEIRQGRNRNERAVAECRCARRRLLPGPQHAHRSGQSRARGHVVHDRFAGAGPAQHGGVAVVRTWAAKPKTCRRFVVMTSSDKGKTCGQLFFDYYWGSGFLPSRFQGVRFRNTGDLVPYLANPPGVSAAARRSLLDDIAAMNAEHLADYGDPEIDTRIAQYEMAFRMQTSVPDLVDFSEETAATIERYGPDALVKGTYANNCLIARRLAGARRPVCAADAFRLGSTRQSVHATGRSNATTPSALGGARARPERTRHARRHAGRLGWRIRPHAVWPGRSRQTEWAAIILARPTVGGWPAAASSRARSMARPTISPGTSRQTPSMFTTCKPRFCIFAASTTLD